MPKQNFTKTAYDHLDDFVYGHSIHPIPLKNGMVIGGGTIYPEVNFTLPAMPVEDSTIKDVVGIYKEIITGICDRAAELFVPGFVAEIETLPPMTFRPEWGTEIAKTVVDVIKEHEAKTGIKGAVRITPNDIREGKGLEHMWHGTHWDAMLKTFVGSAKAGADFLSIESIGGKEVHDDAIMFCDIEKSIFALSVLGAKDMNILWTEIVRIAEETGTIAAGDTACGFANTAMVMADKKYVPKVFSAAVRVISAVRSLIPAEVGAKGPHKDCGYEGVYVKAISGTPIATEGRVAACAHLSPVGNISFAVADLWSNESIQFIKLLGGDAPTVSFEQLSYDTRLANVATARGPETARLLRDLNVESDSKLDPQAYVLRPDVVLDISKEIVKVDGYYLRAKKAAILALEHLRKGYESDNLILDDKEIKYVDKLQATVEGMTDDVDEFTARMIPATKGKLDPAKYDL